MIGETISHYKITEKLGEGGMGVVYKAEDTKLERTVALKFLAAHLLNDNEAKQRFLREAKAAAALHHPNICTVHEIDEADGRTFLAMAYLKGETLEDRIAKGPLSLKDALDIGRQIADGLEAAHKEGIVHRDIKPANILVSPEGRATIMDFGLARLTEASRLTKADQTMGTVAYMSPEQAQGMEVNHRADIWALGCVLYEMVCGQRPFRGVYDKALLYEIVSQQPEPLTGLRTGVPIELEFLTSKCLAKDAADRYQHASEAAVDLRTLAEKLKSGRSTILHTANLGAGVPATVPAGQTVYPAAVLPADAVVMKRSSKRALQAVAAIATLFLLGVLAIHFTQAPPETSEKLLRRFSFTTEGVFRGSISPDGKYIAYDALIGGRSSLWLRSLATETSREVPGTERVRDFFWSPDSLSLGFAVGEPDFELKRVSIDVGSPLTLCALPAKGARNSFVGGTWSPDGERIVFSSGLRLYEIASRGGQPQLLFEPGDSPRSQSVYPHFLPADGGPAALIYVAATGPANQWVAVLNLETGERRELVPGRQPVYSSDGYLLHGPTSGLDQGLWALPFSLSTLQPAGEDFPISVGGDGASVSRDGTLVYRDRAGSEMGMKTLVWRNRTGEISEKVGQPQAGLREFELSPDRRWVATTVAEPASIWIQDLTRATTTRLTFGSGEPGESRPSWAPSGREISYALAIGGGTPQRLMRKAADGRGEPAVLVESDYAASNADWSRDGRYLVFHGPSGETTSNDILYVELEAGGDPLKPKIFLSTPAAESAPKLSPDGRFVAYVSNESGRPEVYVRPFPSGDGRWQASPNGGAQPRWRSDGKELFYVENRNTMLAVPVSTGQGLTLGQPQRLFQSADLIFRNLTWPQYDVSGDGQRFLTSTPVQGDTPPTIRIVQNWYEEFRDRERN